MKISYSWLKDILNFEETPQEVAELLTSSGLEVEGIDEVENVKGGLKGLVVGKVISCEKHPDADKLSLTTVDVGTENLLSIVCGAPNVAQNQKVVVATIGTKLFPLEGEPFEIKKSKIRGALSEGMLCAEDEIGLGKSHAGIIVLDETATIGEPIANLYNLQNDTVFEIGLTPNRSDATSHYGVARDLKSIIAARKNKLGSELQIKHSNFLPDASNLNKIEIEVLHKESCPRYAGMVISGVTVKPSPEWLKNKLISIGLKPINNIVDITNYVLHDLGQPLHAFDYDKISGKKVIVRLANENEKFVTLDGVERTLQTNDLVIADEAKPMCLAGVFGGLNSGVSESTTSVFLECAYFNPAYIRKSSKHHALKTDASFRFERGTDPNFVLTAINKTANLILEIAGGTLSMDVVDIKHEEFLPNRIAFSYNNCDALIGKKIDRNLIKLILTELGIEIENEGNDALLLNVPLYKTDVTREADVIEEVMRVYGYNNIETSKLIKYSAITEPKNFNLLVENLIGDTLSGFGFNEIMSLSLTNENNYEQKESLVQMLNPLSTDLGVLRQSLLFDGLKTIAYNINRKQNDLKLFEIGKTYFKTNNEKFPYSENKVLALFITGANFTENAYGLNQQNDFMLLKSVAIKLLEKMGITTLKFSESTFGNFENGLSILVNNKSIAEIGKVSKKVTKQNDVNQPVFYAEFNFEALVKLYSKHKIQFVEPSKFPSVRRDLALLIDKTIKYQQLEELAFATDKKILKEVNLFDIYEGEKLGNKKSYALSFTLQDTEATLTDKQIDGVMEKLVNNFKQKLNAELR